MASEANDNGANLFSLPGPRTDVSSRKRPESAEDRAAKADRRPTAGSGWPSSLPTSVSTHTGIVLLLFLFTVAK